MDASNPVISSDRSTIENMLERARGVKRQDLLYLQEVAATSQRIILPSRPVIPATEVSQIMEEFKKQQPTIGGEKTSSLDPKIFSPVYDSVPVCGLMNSDGLPLHPAGVNNKQGRLHVSRTMGGAPSLPHGFAEVVAVLGDDVLQTKFVYTAGTWAGFAKRLAEQMGRKTVPLLKTLGEGKPLSVKAAIKKLDQLMPRDPNPQWPGSGESFYDDLTTGIKITMNSSAGAPYWRNKSECLEDIVDVGIPVIMKALKENSLDKLWRENPEMFICEVKNKTDRYEKSKLDEKTRPYVCVPAHWAFLFSMLTQGFQEGLRTFVQDAKSSNAYGFSSSKGGLKRMVSWMYAADRRGRVACYGDDACIVVRRGQKLYRIDPDFKQMDGSLDAADIDLTVEWVMEHHARDTGARSPFWTAVAHQWKMMSTNPVFVVDGTTVYRKVSKNGLMTGVPGTTLFDTVKSVLAWNQLLDESARGDVDILDERAVTKWMLAQGLVVKPGTWNPTPLPENPAPGDLITDHKFLGVQIRKILWRDTDQYVPTIPYGDAVEMLVTQKDDPFVTNKVSRTMKARTLFDRMRGLMITMGFDHPLIVEAIHNVVNHIPPEVILMQVQNGTGERPDHITLQDFNYPDSSGFPTVDFAISVYADLDVSVPWTQIFPDLTERLEEFKKRRRDMDRKYKTLLHWDTHHTKLEPTLVPEEPKPLNNEYSYVETSVDKVDKRDPTIKAPNPRSKIVRVNPTGETPEKRLPDIGETIVRYLVSRGGVCPVADVAYDLDLWGTLIVKEAAKSGFYVTGPEDEDTCSLRPVVTAYPSEQEEVHAKLTSSKNLITPSVGRRDAALKAAAHHYDYVAAAPELVCLRLDLLENLTIERAEVSDREEALRVLNKSLAQSGYSSRWVTDVDHKRSNPVSAQLVVRHTHFGEPKMWTTIAQAWSANAGLAQDYVTRAIMDTFMVNVPESRFSVRFVPPPVDIMEGGNWADEIGYDDDPLRPPVPIPFDSALEKPDPDQVSYLQKEMPWVPLKFVHAALGFCVRLPLDQRLPQALKILRLADERVHHWSSTSSSESVSSPSPTSRRGKMSPEARAKQNRRLLERRKRQRTSLAQSS